MRRPTDREILREIYERYYDAFSAHSDEEPTRSSKIYVPIDILTVATQFGVDGDIIFGRLYYHLNKKHGYTQDDGSYVHLFTIAAGKDRHCVNFPLLAGILADLEHENRKFWWPTGIALFSLFVSILSIVMTLSC